MHLISSHDEDPDDTRDRQYDQAAERADTKPSPTAYNPFASGKSIGLAVLRRLDGNGAAAERELTLATQWLDSVTLPDNTYRALAGYADVLGRFVKRSM